MLKTRLFPTQNVFSDRSDIVALHAKLLRCKAIAIYRRALSDSVRLEARHSADISADTLPYFESSSTSKRRTEAAQADFQLSIEAQTPRREYPPIKCENFLGIPPPDVSSFLHRDMNLSPSRPAQQCIQAVGLIVAPHRHMRSGQELPCLPFGKIKLEKHADNAPVRLEFSGAGVCRPRDRKRAMISGARPPLPIFKPQLPDGVRIYAISDIHGCAHLLRPMLRVIDADVAHRRPRYAIEIFMGDYIDRGPDTRATLDILVERSRRGNAVFLKGNHEAFLVRIFEDPSLFEDWIGVGGAQTLMSYGLAPPDLKRDEPATILRDLIRAMPTEHLEFLDNLRLSFTCGDFFFVHAGVRPGVPLAEQTERDLLWIRDEFLRSDQQFGKYIVHGHTPVRSAEFQANRVNIDTGAYATGNLTLMSIQGSRMLAV